MDTTSLQFIQSHENDYKINWKFYTDSNDTISKEYTNEHLMDLLMCDCHSVFRTNKDGIIDWVGYNSDNDNNDVCRNMLIENPELILQKVLEDSTIYITLGGNYVFRYATITLKYIDPPFYIITDYDATFV